MTQTAVFGGGCFWCTEAVFSMLRGVKSVVSGYAGGPSTSSGLDPDYEHVSTGETGHAEVIKIEFDPTEIKYGELLEVFFAAHDPTTRNRQGNDVGSQYRSVIFYTNDGQKQLAEAEIGKLRKTGMRVVTEVKPLDKFYPAEEYHQKYYENNKSAPYCQIIIDPKIEKIQQKYAKILKK